MRHPSRSRDRRKEPRPFQSEPLERRVLLTTLSQWPGLNVNLATQAAFVNTVSGTMVTTTVLLSNQQPMSQVPQVPFSGTVSIEWSNGQPAGQSPTNDIGGAAIATATGVDSYPSTFGTGYATLTFPLNVADAEAADPAMVYPSASPKILAYLVAEYSGPDYPDTWGAITQSVLFVAGSRVAFIQNPSNSAVGDTIKPPITVAVEDSSGNYQTTSTDSITLSLAGSSTGTGTLSGTTTEAAVAGIATFSDLSINAGGNYTLTATDNTNTGFTAATSSSFNITTGRLVFLQPLATSQTADQPLSPTIQVELEDGSGNAITSEDGAIVTLALIGATDANPITGNTATLSGGIATFSNVVLTKPGTYQLQASDPNGDAMGTSNKFGIGGDTLKFLLQPKNADPNSPLSVKVEALTPKGKLDTQTTDSVALSLNVISGGTNAALAGILTAPLVGGMATFTATKKISINSAGTYTLTATPTTVDDSGNTSTDFGATAAKSDSFVISGLKLKVLTEPPTSVDVAAPFTLAVEIVDSKGKVSNVSNAQCVLSLNTTAGSPAATLKGTATAAFAGGIARFTSAAGLSINGVGTFTLTASENTDTPATPVDTRSIKVKGYSLSTGFRSKYDALNDDVVPLQGVDTVKILDPSGKPVNEGSIPPTEFPNVQLTLTPVSGTGTLVDSAPVPAASYFGTKDVEYVVADNITTPGTYLLTVTPIDTPGSVIPYTSIAASKPYQIEVVNHALLFRQSIPQVENDPPIIDAHATGVPVPGAEYEDGKPVLPLKSSVGFELILNPIGSTGNLVAFGGATQLDARTIVFAAPGVLDEPSEYTIDEPGRYTITEAEVITPSDQPFDPANFAPEASVAPLISAPFLVLSDKLAFIQQPPAKLSIGQTFSVEVAIEDNDGKILTDFSPGTDPNFTAGALLGILAKLSVAGPTVLQGADTAVNFVNGIATFSNVSFNASGFFSLSATEQNQYQSDGPYSPSPVPTVAKSVLIRVLKGT